MKIKEIQMKVMKMKMVRNQKVKSINQSTAIIRVMMKVILRVNIEHLDNSNRYLLSCMIINRNCLEKVMKNKRKMKLLKGMKTQKKKLIKMIMIMIKEIRTVNALIDKILKKNQEENKKKNSKR